MTLQAQIEKLRWHIHINEIQCWLCCVQQARDLRVRLEKLLQVDRTQAESENLITP